ncbi:MAG TPA: hypothetical protein VFS21_05155 [Roseiflexaceae bacterium]|nr:hypothetical protein [Roseiflexaceae bacterium]
MISLDLARRLRQAGLPWQPAEHDMFALPDRQMDGQIFVISAQPALLQLYNGDPVVTFHGSTEWALDYVFLSEVIWLPNEAQLREALAQQLGPDAPLRLDRTAQGYRCTFAHGEELREAVAPDAASAYALALLELLEARG